MSAAKTKAQNIIDENAVGMYLSAGFRPSGYSTMELDTNFLYSCIL